MENFKTMVLLKRTHSSIGSCDDQATRNQNRPLDIANPPQLFETQENITY